MRKVWSLLGMSVLLLGARPSPSPVEAGRELFVRTWEPWDARAAHGGDGLGPMYNATSCVACHAQGGIGGAGGAHTSVKLAAFDKAGPFHVDHKFSTLGAVTSTKRVVQRAVRNTPALFGAGLIDTIPEDAMRAVALAQAGTAVSGRLPVTDANEVGRFGWKGHSASLADFVATACAAELGLSVPGKQQSTPPPGVLADSWGQVERALGSQSKATARVDMTAAEVDALTAFVRALPRPEEHPTPDASKGRARFDAIGCADCHKADLGGVEGLYSDLLLHDIGFGDGAAGYGTLRSSTPIAAAPKQVPALDDFFGIDSPLSEIPEVVRTEKPAEANEFRTPPLWGVRDSGPWMHDGRAQTLQHAIENHRGEATVARNAYAALGSLEKLQVVAFLESLTAPTTTVASR